MTFVCGQPLLLINIMFFIHPGAFTEQGTPQIHFPKVHTPLHTPAAASVSFIKTVLSVRSFCWSKAQVCDNILPSLLLKKL